MYKYNSKAEPERTTISVSKENYLKLKKLGETADTFNDVLTKILAKQPGVYKIDVGGTEKE